MQAFPRSNRTEPCVVPPVRSGTFHQRPCNALPRLYMDFSSGMLTVKQLEEGRRGWKSCHLERGGKKTAGTCVGGVKHSPGM